MIAKPSRTCHRQRCKGESPFVTSASASASAFTPFCERLCRRRSNAKAKADSVSAQREEIRMFDPASVSKLAHDTGLPLDEARAICAQIECKAGVTNPFALARSWCLARKRSLAAAAEAAAHVAKASEQAAASPRAPLALVPPAAAASRCAQDREPFAYADPEIAHAELAKIREIIGDRSSVA